MMRIKAYVFHFIYFFILVFMIVYVLFLSYIRLIPIGYLYVSLFKNKENNKSPTVPKLFFGLVTIEEAIPRRNLSYNVWIKNILNLGHDYLFCTQEPIEPIYKWVKLKNWALNPPPKNPTKKFLANRDRENKRLTLANYFLKETTADFFINPTDDVFVDYERINNLAMELGNKYDSEKDFILLGNCIAKGPFSFVQGGSGYIMTRAMARQFVIFSERWLKEAIGPDDFEMSRFMSYLNQIPCNATCPYMCGHNLGDLINKNIDLRKLPVCPSYYESVCMQGVNKIEDLYIIHPLHSSLQSGFLVWTNFKNMIHDKDHHYGWYNTFTTHVCRFD